MLQQSQIQIHSVNPIADIVLYDRTGKSMSTISGYIPEGNHTILFERMGLSAGQYYLQARLINGYTQSVIVNIQ
jgi:thioredoxin-related protein